MALAIFSSSTRTISASRSRMRGKASPRLTYLDPVREGLAGLHEHRSPRLQRLHRRGAGGRLHPWTRTRGSTPFTAAAIPAMSPPPPIDAGARSVPGKVLEDLEPQGPLPGDEIRIIETGDVQHPIKRGILGIPDALFQVSSVGENSPSRRRSGTRPAWRPMPRPASRPWQERPPPGRPRPRPGHGFPPMPPRPPSPPISSLPGEGPVHGSPHLERAGLLHGLDLQVDLVPAHRRESGGVHERGADDV